MNWRQIPNYLTMLRLVLAFFNFIVFSIYLATRTGGGGFLGSTQYDSSAAGQFFASYEWWLLNGLFVIFLLAAVTDVLDGMLARRWNVTTAFGRIADPFADKILISGNFVLFVPLGADALPIAPWMVVAILAREYLVTGIRGYAESLGVAFPASRWGKAKMLLQSFCVGTLLVFLGNEGIFNPWIAPFLKALVWATVLVTLISGVVYIQRARSILTEAEGDVESPCMSVESSDSITEPDPTG